VFIAGSKFSYRFEGITPQGFMCSRIGLIIRLIIAMILARMKMNFEVEVRIW
jgi:hypothetical protein